MKKLLIALLGLIGLVALNPSVFAIDAFIHDIADHTIGYGHHRHYYGYDYGYSGYAAYPGYYGYGRPYYRHTHAVWPGSHYHRHWTGLGHFRLGHRHGHGHGHHH
ncbi:MAG TPA: hypothetical protein VFA51_12730 [Candidatus Udaeobacter sp.]|nr:hypothetical protein [Candidatus Udaeobacter sp.]